MVSIAVDRVPLEARLAHLTPLYGHRRFSARLILDEPNPPLDIDRRPMKVVRQRGLRQASIPSTPAAASDKLTDRSFDRIPLMHRVLELIRLHQATTALKMIVVLAYHQCSPA